MKINSQKLQHLRILKIYKEVFSPTIPKDSSKKGKSHLKRNSKSSSKTSAQGVGRIKPRSRTKSKSLPQSNKYCGQSGSSSEKLAYRRC